MHAALLTILIVTGAGDSTSAPQRQPATAPKIAAHACSETAVAGQPSGAATGYACPCSNGWCGLAPLPNGGYPRCGWLGKRWSYRYPPSYDFFRAPHDYRRSFDYPWGVVSRVPACFPAPCKADAPDGAGSAGSPSPLTTSRPSAEWGLP
jgi:hypothetical protein